MKKILSISNSFGVDATRYLYGVARSEGEKVKVVTLYIGACSLYRHYRNMLSEDAVYDYYINGFGTGLKVSMKQALLMDEWDVVALQESGSGKIIGEGYTPFIEPLAEYVRKLVPCADLYVHSTWAYSDAKIPVSSFESRAEMLESKRVNDPAAVKLINAKGLLPSSDAMNALVDTVGDLVAFRDGYHANAGMGRYMLACVWFGALFGKDMTENKFRDFDVPTTEEEARLAAKLATDAIRKWGYIK